MDEVWAILSAYSVAWISKGKGIFANLLGRYLRLGKWKYFVVFIGIVLLLFFLFSDGNSLPQPVTTPDPPKTPAFETEEFQRMVLLGICVLLGWVIIAFIYEVGKITLSAQTLVHRRNVLLALSIIILSEIFEIDISGMLGINLGDDSSPDTSEADGGKGVSINGYAYGVLGFFLIYSFVEYSFTFVSDLLKSRAEWKNNNAGKPDAKATIFVLGVYRAIFDVLLPAIALIFVVSYYSAQTKDFVTVATNTLLCGSANLASVPEKSHDEIISSLDELEKICPKCIHAISDIRNSLDKVDEYARTEFDWKSFECSENG